MTGGLLKDAVAHHIWATEQLIDACAALTSLHRATGRETAVHAAGS